MNLAEMKRRRLRKALDGLRSAHIHDRYLVAKFVMREKPVFSVVSALSQLSKGRFFWLRPTGSVIAVIALHAINRRKVMLVEDWQGMEANRGELFYDETITIFKGWR